MNRQRTGRIANRVLGALLFTVVVLFVTQCKKIELVPNQEGEVVFKAQMGVQDQDSISFFAGLDSIEMFTTFELGADNVYRFIGEFRDQWETPNTASLRFEFTDIDDSNVFDADSALLAGVYGFLGAHTPIISYDTSFFVKFTADSFGNCITSLPTSILYWSIDDQIDIATGTEYIHEYNKDTTSQVRLSVKQGGIESYSITHDVPLGEAQSTCSAKVVVTSVVDSFVLTVVASGGQMPYSYSWSTGSTLDTFYVPIDTPVVDTNYVVTVQDANGCETTVEVKVPLQNNMCGADFSFDKYFEIDTITTPVQSIYSKVRIIYTDTVGTVYQSDLNAQDASAFFNLNAVDAFSNNDEGQKTKKLNVSFDCQLFDQNNNAIRVSCINGVIGVAHP